MLIWMVCFVHTKVAAMAQYPGKTSLFQFYSVIKDGNRLRRVGSFDCLGLARFGGSDSELIGSSLSCNTNSIKEHGRSPI